MTDVFYGGDRVIVPPAGHSIVLEVLHDGHPGVTKMKQLARSICLVAWNRQRFGK